MIHTLYFDDNGNSSIVDSEKPRLDIDHYIDGKGHFTSRVTIRAASWMTGKEQKSYYVASIHPLSDLAFREAVEKHNPIPVNE